MAINASNEDFRAREGRGPRTERGSGMFDAAGGAAGLLEAIALLGTLDDELRMGTFTRKSEYVR